MINRRLAQRAPEKVPEKVVQHRFGPTQKSPSKSPTRLSRRSTVGIANTKPGTSQSPVRKLKQSPSPTSRSRQSPTRSGASPTRSTTTKSAYSPYGRQSTKSPAIGGVRNSALKSPKRSPKRAVPVESIQVKSPTRSNLQGFNPAKYGSVAAYKESQEHRDYLVQREQILRQLNMNQNEKQQKLNKIKMQIDEIQRDKEILVNLNLDMVTLERIQYEYNATGMHNFQRSKTQKSPRGGQGIDMLGYDY